MTLIYLVATQDSYKRNSICVRAEIMVNREEPIVLYRSYQTNSFKLAKMRVMIDIFSRFNFSKCESITVYADDEDIAWEWNEICSSDKPINQYRGEWRVLLPYLFQFSLKPRIKDKGYLTTVKISDMKLHMHNNEF